MRSSRPSRRALLGVAGLAVAGPLAACDRGTPAPPSPTSSAPPAPSASAPPPSASVAPRPSPSRAAQAAPAPGPDITHGPRTRDAVALTFHGDGPDEIVRGVLAALARADARVTVLAIGRWLAAEPRLAGMIRDGGHELGNHTWSHQPMTHLGPGQVRTEVDRAATELVRLTGSPGRWFRPSGTPHSTPAVRAAATAAGYGACLGYDVDPLDYTDPGPAAIRRATAGAVRHGSVVSLHLGHPGTLTALPGVLRDLHDRGLAPVTASELLLNG